MAELDHEEKRLLESFRMHEIEVARINGNGTAHGAQTTGRVAEGENREIEGRENSDDGPGKLKEEAREKSLVKEEEVLGGTFGDPSKLKREELLESEVVDPDFDKENKETDIRIKTEPGPAFMNSSMQDKTPSSKCKTNPFHWEASEVATDNLSKLVYYE